MTLMQVLIVFFFVDVALSVLRQIYFFQLKEYRFDKIKTAFIYEGQFTKYFSFYRVLLYLTVFLTFMIGSAYFFYPLILSLLFNLFQTIAQGFLRPKLTAKSCLVLALSVFILCLLFISNQSTFSMQLVYLATPIVTTLSVVIFKPITFFLKTLKVHKAKNHLQTHFPKLKVIGVTGSFGKSSTKQFIHKLTQSLNSVCIPGNINTEIGVANFILKKLPKDTKTLIIEMGAYSKKEISRITQIAPPDISVVTAVDKMHLTLFKSLDNIFHAKSEIIAGLKSKGKAFFCLENSNIPKFIDFLHQHYPLDKRFQTVSNSQSADYSYSYVSSKYTRNLAIFKENFKFNLAFEYLIPTLVLAIMVAHELKVPAKEIQTALQKIQECDLNIELFKTANDIDVLNDSYNSNLKGFKYAIQFAKGFKASHKVLLNSGLKELGSDSKQVHTELYAQAAKCFDKIILSERSLKKYIPKQFKSKFVVINKPKALLKEIKTLKSKSLLVIEGRTFANVAPYLKPKSK